MIICSRARSLWHGPGQLFPWRVNNPSQQCTFLLHNVTISFLISDFSSPINTVWNLTHQMPTDNIVFTCKALTLLFLVSSARSAICCGTPICFLLMSPSTHNWVPSWKLSWNEDYIVYRGIRPALPSRNVEAGSPLTRPRAGKMGLRSRCPSPVERSPDQKGLRHNVGSTADKSFEH